MSSFMMMMVMQMVMTAWCIRWYAKKHPAEASEMFEAAKMRAKRMMSR